MDIIILDNFRPECITKGCTNPAADAGKNYKNGARMYKRVCHICHSKRVAEKHGLETINQVIAKNAGFSNYVDYINSKHPYRKYRKDYCENIDGRLGFTCTTTVSMPAILQVDHINGNPKNNKEKNLQTLCACCHIHKTHLNKDYLTPGRKALKVR